MTQPRKRKYDLTLLAALLALLVFGLIILYSTSAYNGEVKFHDSFYYLKKQVFATLLGILGMYLAARTDYHLWKYAALPGYLAALLLSVAVRFHRGKNTTAPKDGFLWGRFHFSLRNSPRWR